MSDIKNDPSTPLSGAAVQREILAAALQHPVTLYPFAVAALAASYGVFVAPFLGAQPWALLIAVVSGLGSIASFTWRYFVQGESAARARAQQLLAQEEGRRRDTQEGELEALREELAGVFHQLRSAEGQEALARLSDEFQEVREALERTDRADPVAEARAAASARQTYQAGLTALADAKELLEAVQGLSRDQMEAEITQGRAELHRLAESGAEPERIRLEKRTLEASQRTLELLEQQSHTAERLIHEADLAAMELRRLRVSVPALEGLGPVEAIQDMSAALEVPGPRVGGSARSSQQAPVEEERAQRA